MTEQARQPKPRGTDLIGTKAVAKMLQIAPRTVKRLVEQGNLARPVRHGDRAMWYVNDVRVYKWRLLRGEFRKKRPVPEVQKVDKKGHKGEKAGEH